MDSQSTATMLFYVSIFQVEPPDQLKPLEGSCGFMWWHIEVVNHTRDGQLTTYLLVYQSSRRMVENMFEELPAMKASAKDLANMAVLPVAFRGQEHFGLKYLCTYVFNEVGKDLGGDFSGRVLGKLGPSRYVSGDLYPTLNDFPKLKMALLYYDVGLFFAELGLYTDSCMNYVRAVEALMGMYKNNMKKIYSQECLRAGLNFDQVKKLMSKIRNSYAVAHVTGTPDKGMKLKPTPGKATEKECREICRTVINFHLEEARGKQEDERYRALYKSFHFGDPVPVPTLWDDLGSGFGSPNLPKPEELITGFLSSSESSRILGKSPQEGFW